MKKINTKKETFRTSLRCVLGVSALGLVGLGSASPAAAFCGFYVSGATSDLYARATTTVLMRSGMRTVLSMQNDYAGPPEDFAMVVPVPVILKKEEVKTLPREVFARVDAMASPRLVEYWEQDPCAEESFGGLGISGIGFGGGGAGIGRLGGLGSAGVKVEAQFKVGEYEIVILSAKDSGGLDAWLREHKYNIPKGAEEALRPYVEGGMYFFVAKVDVDKVRFADGRARLSPLRFHYESKEFTLPVRLGLLNADGPQDLLVHILAPSQRYEVANYPNATIPTNLDVAPETASSFGAFYAALFDEVQAQQPGAVVTEYAWAANTCDPCPGPTLGAGDFLTLGGDVLPSGSTSGLVLTRLHARYDKNSLREDLVFHEASPLHGGREVYRGGTLETGAAPGTVNNFQARYAIRHPWQGEITCDRYTRGRWGARPANVPAPPTPAPDGSLGTQGVLRGGGSGLSNAPERVRPMRDLAYAPRTGFDLAGSLRSDLPALKLKATTTTRSLLALPALAASTPPSSAPPTAIAEVTNSGSAAPTAPTAPVSAAPTPPQASGSSCAVSPGAPAGGGLGAALLLGLGALLARRR